MSVNQDVDFFICIKTRVCIFLLYIFRYYFRYVRSSISLDLPVPRVDQGYHIVIRAPVIDTHTDVVPVKNIPSQNGGAIIYPILSQLPIREPVKFNISTPLSMLKVLYFFSIFKLF